MPKSSRYGSDLVLSFLCFIFLFFFCFSLLDSKHGVDEGAEPERELVCGEAHDVVEAALDARHEAAAHALDPVRPSLVQGLACVASRRVACRQTEPKPKPKPKPKSEKATSMNCIFDHFV